MPDLPSDLPSGIVTFLFTDVEGSTRLVRNFGDAHWAQMLETHRRILRDAFAANAGREVGTQGDSFFAVFARATDAVAAAIDGQRALEAHPWPDNSRVRVRIGIHTGQALAHGGNYTGQEVHRASRICNAGHGGQIVVSRSTAELVREGLPDGAVLTDLGDHRLEDMGEPQRRPATCRARPRARFPSARREACRCIATTCRSSAQPWVRTTRDAHATKDRP